MPSQELHPEIRAWQPIHIHHICKATQPRELGPSGLEIRSWNLHVNNFHQKVVVIQSLGDLSYCISKKTCEYRKATAVSYHIMIACTFAHLLSTCIINISRD